MKWADRHLKLTRRITCKVFILKFRDYKYTLKEGLDKVESEVKILSKIKANKEDAWNKITAQIREIEQNTDRIDEKLEIYQNNRQFLKDIHEYKGIQKLKNSVVINRQSSKIIDPNVGIKYNLNKELLKAQSLLNFGMVS